MDLPAIDKARLTKPLMPSRIDLERAIVAATDEPTQTALTSQFAHWIKSLLAVSLIRDARHFSKSLPPRWIDEERKAWDCARRNVIADYKSLYSDSFSRDSIKPAPFASSGPLIDVTSSSK